jgi:hypothetical protein
MTDRPPPFALTDQERVTPLWIRLMAHFDDRLRRLRLQNDNATLTAEQTAAIRGEIACVKALQRLNTPRPDPLDEQA